VLVAAVGVIAWAKPGTPSTARCPKIVGRYLLAPGRRSGSLSATSVPFCAGMLVAEQQFRRIIGYRDLAKLVIAVERHAILTAPNSLDPPEIAQPVTV
jgi:hypothetical protein